MKKSMLSVLDAGTAWVHSPGIGPQGVGPANILPDNPAARLAYDRGLRYFYGKHYPPPVRLLLSLFLRFYRSRSIAAE
jgi:hypothetical protein